MIIIVIIITKQQSTLIISKINYNDYCNYYKTTKYTYHATKEQIELNMNEIMNQ